MRTLLRRGLVVKFLLGIFVVAGVCGPMAVKTPAASYYWDTNGGTAGAGGTPSGTWQSSCSNWSTNSAGSSTISAYTTQASDVLYFVAGPGAASGNNDYTVTVGGGSQLAGGLHFQSSGPPTLSGTGSILLGSDGITIPQFAYGTTAQGAVNISSQVILQAAQSWSNSSSNALAVSGPVADSGYLLTIGGPGNTTVSGVISGGGGLAKSGSGIVTLLGANTFAGTTTISGGTLDLSNANALQFSTLQAPTAGSVVFDQSVSGAFNLGGLSGSGSLSLQNNASAPAAVTLSVGAIGGSTTYGGVLSGSGALAKVGNGIFTLVGTNSYCGGTKITGGTL